jgi:hypothetical protein
VLQLARKDVLLRLACNRNRAERGNGWQADRQRRKYATVAYRLPVCKGRMMLGPSWKAIAPAAVACAGPTAPSS